MCPTSVLQRESPKACPSQTIPSVTESVPYLITVREDYGKLWQPFPLTAWGGKDSDGHGLAKMSEQAGGEETLA